MPVLTDRNYALELLRRALSSPNAKFRDGQWEAIDALVNHRRKLLVVERTGWGKSSVYFIATRILRDRELGLTLIVSPLLALMRNQIVAAERLGIRALTINSTNQEDWPLLAQAILDNEADAVLISPERLSNDYFVQTVLLPIANRIGLLVVDEAHCISDWGHDFRPDYRRLVNVLQYMPPNMAVLGTTATANNRVVNDVCAQLGGVDIQRGSLMRESLVLQTLRLDDQAARLAWLAEHVPTMPGTGIIYTLTIRDAEQVANWLNNYNISARAYHSKVLPDLADDADFLESDHYAEFLRVKANPPHGFKENDSLSNYYRQHLEDLLLSNQLKALVATTALGMGYDKPDLGFVVHYQAPSSIVGYYQQVGRAGRDIDYAVGVLMAGREDEEIQEYFRSSAFPAERDVNAILQILAESDGRSVIELQRDLNLTQGQILKVLKFLSVDNPAPVLQDGPKWVRTPVDWRMDHERISHLTRQRAVEWDEVQAYIDSDECLMVFLARALDDEHPELCGKCARCRGEAVVPEQVSHQMVVAAALYLKHSELPLTPRKQTVTGGFPVYGFPYRLPTELQAQEGRILSRWGDAGWGRMVAEDKHHNHFRDELVVAVTEMILERWQPEPAPAWVTCVPSRKHPELVPNFARRLAANLCLPFVDAVQKVRDNGPQKLQRNSYHQCRNLDGVFDVAAGIPNGPVLLVDDMVDSAWTMTVVATLLRRAGSGPVWPVALASTSTGD